MQNYFNSKKINNSLTLFLSATVFSFLAGCGDGGSSKTTTCGTACASTVQLMVSSQQMSSSAIASTDLTAVVLDAAGQAVSGKVVTFAKGTDRTAYFSNLSATTNSNGVATATLNIGADMSNRMMAISATADTAVGSNTVTITGTKISISGNTSLALNASSTLSIIVKDSTGVAVPGVTLAVASQNGNPVVLTPATGVTDSTGQITAVVTAVVSGNDVLTVTGAGATQSQTLTINNANFAFTAPTAVAPATTPEIAVSTPATPVSVTWTNAGVPVVGSTVYFYTSRGTITLSAVTNASGIATANVAATSTGATIITAAGTGGTPAATLNVVFITTSASSIAAQANPGTVAVNTSGSTAKQSVISVVVRDSANNLVKNAHVSFTQFADSSGGSLAANTATTDISGAASVNYIAGTTSTGPNAVRIDATVDAVNGVALGAPITSSAYLTVASQALYVRLGTDNKIYPNTPVAGVHTKQYTAVVTDAAGNYVADGTEVRFTLRPPSAAIGTAFAKGYFTWGGTSWGQTITKTCANEDANRNGTVDALEDTNGNGRLDPLGVATVNATATTVSGFAIAKISYPAEYSYWAAEDLEARAGTVGNDPPSVITFTLPGLATDYTTQNAPPPGETSPFGAGVVALSNNVCTNTQ